MARSWQKILSQLVDAANASSASKQVSMQFVSKPFLHGRLVLSEDAQIVAYTDKCKSKEEVCKKLVQHLVKCCNVGSPEELLLRTVVFGG